MHLWFLYYLLICYAVMLVWRPIFKRLGFARGSTRKLLGHPFAVGGLTLLTLPLLVLMKTWQVDSPGGWVPQPQVLAYYYLFFAVGWFLYGEQDLFWKLAARWPRYLISAAVVLPIAAICTAAGLPLELTGKTAELGRAFVWIKAAAIVAQGLYTWFLVWGSIGLFQKLLDRANSGVRYLADASYWCYLMSMTPILLLQIVLEPLPWPGFIKFVVVCSLSLASLVLSYEAWVRYTWLGNLLHGPKEPPRAVELVESRAGTV
jgi:hypothetical protein